MMAYVLMRGNTCERFNPGARFDNDDDYDDENRDNEDYASFTLMNNEKPRALCRSSGSGAAEY